MYPCHPYLRRATTSVLVAVAVISGAILLLGDRFGAAPGDALAQPVRPGIHMAACVADESMRLIDPNRERCRPGERELGPQGADGRDAARPSGPAGPAGGEGVSGFELVSAPLTVPARAAATGEAGCPAGKVAVGGGVVADPDSTHEADGTEDRVEPVSSGPVLPGGYGWTATVKNATPAPLTVIVAAVCLTLR